MSLSSAGMVFYYCLFQLAVWWFCHVVSLFWKIRFPFHARSFETAHRLKYIHIVMVIVGLVLPTLPVIVAFTAGTPSTRGFGLTRFPPILCTSLERDSTFYSLVLPINILLAVGVPLLIIIFWIIHKVYPHLIFTVASHLATLFLFLMNGIAPQACHKFCIVIPNCSNMACSE